MSLFFFINWKVIVFIELSLFLRNYIRRKDNGRKIIFAQNEQRLRQSEVSFFRREDLKNFARRNSSLLFDLIKQMHWSVE